MKRLFVRFVPFLYRKEWAEVMYLSYGRQLSIIFNTFHAFIAFMLYCSVPWLMSNRESCPGYHIILMVVVVDYLRNLIKIENASEAPYLRTVREHNKNNK